jgi:hypothetical protein
MWCPHVDDQGLALPTYWINDARGIPVGKVCERCEEAIRSKYRLDVFEDPNYWADEPVEEDV